MNLLRTTYSSSSDSEEERDNISDSDEYGQECVPPKKPKDDPPSCDDKEKLAIPSEILSLDPTKTRSKWEKVKPDRQKPPSTEMTETTADDNQGIRQSSSRSSPPRKRRRYHSLLPSQCTHVYTDHTDKVNRVEWAKPDGRWLLSTSMDGTVRIWNPHRADTAACHRFLGHNGEAVREAKWHTTSEKIVSGGYDKTAKLWDVKTGRIIATYEHPAYVTAIEFDPNTPDLFIAGCYDSTMKAWDVRVNPTTGAATTYVGSLGQIQDVEFLPDASFVAASDVVRRNALDRAVAAWDVRSGAIVSNQIYLELYTCTALKLRPTTGDHFVAQSHGNYIALFSATPPRYAMNKRKRYEGGHTSAGYPIACSFSPNDGAIIASGSSDGSICYYDYRTARVAKRRRAAHSACCVDVQFHPLLSNIVASCGWDSAVKVWQ
ncbi:WD repeat-containing protein 25-like [Oscarella lobularis]|uniref:WD repeat-containing protein 25-like n=1 Tax=Oscarella lobularis TaxID=121494 RepID=UPI003313E699